MPWIPTAGELKTNRRSTRSNLREIGIQPDILLCRARPPDPGRREAKIALFCKRAGRGGHRTPHADSIYKIPAMLHDQMPDEIVCHKLGIPAKAADLSVWKNLVHAP